MLESLLSARSRRELGHFGDDCLKGVAGVAAATAGHRFLGDNAAMALGYFAVAFWILPWLIRTFILVYLGRLPLVYTHVIGSREGLCSALLLSGVVGVYFGPTADNVAHHGATTVLSLLATVPNGTAMLWCGGLAWHEKIRAWCLIGVLLVGTITNSIFYVNAEHQFWSQRVLAMPNVAAMVCMVFSTFRVAVYAAYDLAERDPPLPYDMRVVYFTALEETAQFVTVIATAFYVGTPNSSDSQCSIIDFNSEFGARRTLLTTLLPLAFFVQHLMAVTDAVPQILIQRAPELKDYPFADPTTYKWWRTECKACGTPMMWDARALPCGCGAPVHSVCLLARLRKGVTPLCPSCGDGGGNGETKGKQKTS